MTKKAKNLGRPKEVSAEDLLERYKALKMFLEHNWGRIGLELQRVRQPEDVRAVLNLVPGLEWCTPFRDHAAKCLIADRATKANSAELRLTRQKHEDSVRKESQLWSDYHGARHSAEEVTTALKVAIAQFQAALGTFPFFLMVSLIARELRVEELTKNSIRLQACLQQAQKEQQSLRETLVCQETWYSRNEVVKFVRSKRYRKTLVNFARAMAGLPQYAWLHSLRKCETIQDQATSPATYTHQVFELLARIVQRTRRLNLTKIEMSLRKELLREKADPLIRAWVSPNWAYMRQAFAECRGKSFNRKELPYKLMARFLANIERPKTIPEVELAKREQLI